MLEGARSMDEGTSDYGTAHSSRGLGRGPSVLLPYPTPVLDRRALAARWGVSIRSIARLEASGTGPRPFRVGRLVRWTLEEVRRFEAKRTLLGPSR